MSIESGIQFAPEKPKISEAEHDLNAIIPILAHGLVRRIEQKGFSGKVRVQALAGDTWGVAKSSDNSTDIPNVIIYPRESLSGDRRLVNARLRHEIGNLNYPIDSEINALRGWCYENKVAPELLTSLVEAIHEASVNYLEMQNSHSDTPQENFRALYEQEINTQQIADGIAQSAPYKQAVDLTLLYSLSQTGLIPHDQFEYALRIAHPVVQETFDKQTRSILDQSVKMAVPKKQVQLVRDFLWPKFSKLVALSSPAQVGSKDGEEYGKKAEDLLEASAREQQAKEMQAKMQKLMEKMKQKPQSKLSKNLSQESKKPKQQELSSAEKQERKEEEDLLAKNLQEQLEKAKEQLEKLQKQGQQPEAKKPQEKPSMQDIGKQAEEMKQQAEKTMQEAKEADTQDKVTEEELQKLKEQLEQLEEVAKQIAESGSLEEELAKPEEGPITYNIKEYGINEANLTPEQLENLQKIRSFAQGTSKVYRTAMRLLMAGYQQHNPKFTDKMIQKMMEHHHDVPDFSIYGSQAAQEFLSQQPELGIDVFSDNFLVNFQLPKPLAKFWYKGGSGNKSQPVKDGEIEWGHFYRMAMPVIYSGVDRAGMSGLYLNRLNGFGQHDPKKYYYLYEAINASLEDQVSESDESDKSEDSEKGDSKDQGVESESGESENGQKSESGESGSQPEQGQGQGAGEGGQEESEGSEPGGAESGGGGMSSAQEMQEILSQMQDMLKQAKEQSVSPGAGQEAIGQLLEQIAQMQESLESGGSPQSMAGQMQDAMQQLSEMMGSNLSQGERRYGEQEQLSEKMSGGEPDKMGFKKSHVENEANSYDPNHQGGAGNTIDGDGVTFSRPDPSLLTQLRNAEALIGSKFTQQDDHGDFFLKSVNADMVAKISQDQLAELERKAVDQLSNLEELKRQHQVKTETLYKEMSGLDGEALNLYVEYMESMKGLTDDLTDFFIEKFDLDKDYVYERNQRRGARLQRGYTKNIVGTKNGRPVLSPRSFERKHTPEMPQFVWTIIIDNTGSARGIIEDEKKLAIALMEVTKRLDIPFEIVIYTEGGYQFLKTFDQEAYGEDLKKSVLLQASIGNQQDTDLLRAAYASQTRYADKFKRAHNFIFFLTDGMACSADSLNDLVNKFKKETVILGVGLAQGAQSIKKEFGKNALEVPDSKQLSIKFIRKVEELIDQAFD